MFVDLVRSIVFATAGFAGSDAVAEVDLADDVFCLQKAELQLRDMLFACHDVQELPILMDDDLFDVTGVLA